MKFHKSYFDVEMHKNSTNTRFWMMHDVVLRTVQCVSCLILRFFDSIDLCQVLQYRLQLFFETFTLYRRYKKDFQESVSRKDDVHPQRVIATTWNLKPTSKRHH